MRTAGKSCAIYRCEEVKRLLKKAAVVLAWICMCAGVGCGAKQTKNITVYTPDGAPAMAFVKMMQEAKDGVEYRVVNPTLIATKVTNDDEKKNADICVLPVTAASKLFGSGERYQALGVLTNGNLYLLSKDENLISTFTANGYKDLSYLLGKTVGVMKINDMPGLTFKWILNDYGLPWQEIGNDGKIQTDKVNLKAITDATAIDAADTGVACYVVAEPAATVQVNKKGFTSVCSLETLYYKGEVPTNVYAGYPQALLLAKRSLLQEKSDWVKSFMEDLRQSTTHLNSGAMDGTTIVETVKSNLEDKAYATTLNAGVLTSDVIARCGVRFTESRDCKQAVIEYLQKISTVDEKVKKVNDLFFHLS